MARQRQKIEQLAELLDSGVEAGEAGGELAGLLTLAASVSEHVQAPTAPADFRAALRAELLAAPPPPPVAAPASPMERLRQTIEQNAPELVQSGRMVAAAAAGAALLGTGGVVTAAQQALPGDLFYGLKGTTEDVRLAFASGDAERGRLHLQFAAERLEELEDGVGRLTPDLLADTLERLDDEVLQAAEDLLDAFAETADEVLVEELTDFTGDATVRLQELQDQLPPEIVPLSERSMEVLRRIEVQAAIATGERVVAETCQSCESLPVADLDTEGVAIPRPGEEPAVPVTECDCTGPTTTIEPAPTSEPEPTPSQEPAEPEPSPEPTQEPAEEPDEDTDVVPPLPEDLQPVGEDIDEAVNDVLDQLPIDPVEELPDPIQEPVEETQETVNETVGEVSETVDDILP